MSAFRYDNKAQCYNIDVVYRHLTIYAVYLVVPNNCINLVWARVFLILSVVVRNRTKTIPNRNVNQHQA